MKAALAIIFFACVAGSMAADRTQFLGQLVEQGQAVAQTVFGHLQQQLLKAVEQAVGKLQSLVGSLGGRFDLGFDFNNILSLLKPAVNGLLNDALSKVLGGLSGLIGGRASFDFGGAFSELLQQLQATVAQVGQHVLNQGLAAVLGGLGSLGGSRVFGDIFESLKQQFGAAVTAAQGALQGAVGGLTQLGSSLFEASKPHFQQLQEQLVGHGLNALGSLSETITNLHGSITGGN